MLSRSILTRSPRLLSRPTITSSILRSYATVTPSSPQPPSQSSSSTANTKPPIPLYGVDGTYASATYTAAAKLSTLDNTSKSLASLLAVLKRDTKLPRLLATPTLTAEDKSAIVAELMKHTSSGSSSSGVNAAEGKGDVVRNLLLTMAEHNRLGMIEGVCGKFAELISAGRGELEVVVVSAQKLDDRTLKRLETAVAKSEYSQGKRLKVVSKVNPDILGGLVVEIGDQTIDLSVSNKVNKMNKLLTDSL